MSIDLEYIYGVGQNKNIFLNIEKDFLLFQHLRKHQNSGSSWLNCLRFMIERYVSHLFEKKCYFLLTSMPRNLIIRSTLIIFFHKNEIS